MNIFIFLSFIGYFYESGTSYTIYSLDDSHVCNQSIYLEQGPNSAAILKLTLNENYSFTPLYCTVSFKAPIHHWSGLTGVLEQVDLRRYEDSGHHLGQSVCVDHITVLTEKPNAVPNERQCGTWSITPGHPLSRLGYNRALFGYCPQTVFPGNAEKCHVTELKVVVSIGRERNEELWRNVSWIPHRGFTFVVTAYSYPIKNGGSECRDGLRLCSQPNTAAVRGGVYHCIHDSLWCDNHVNCGLLENMDEISCFTKGILGGLVTVVIGPWMGASLFLLFLFCAVLYWRSSRVRMMRGSQAENQEINSYAESYELSSNLSSAHHMAIQVRVVCNSNHPHHGTRPHQPWKNDLPPSYDALFPQGPPQPYSPITSIIATVAQGTSGNAVSAVGVNVSSSMSPPSNVVTSSGPSSQPSQSQPSTSAMSEPLKVKDVTTSIIDLNVTSNNLQPPILSRSSDARNSSSVDATISAANTQTSVTLTLTPSHRIATEDQSVSTQSTDTTNNLVQRKDNSSTSTDDNDENSTNIQDASQNTSGGNSQHVTQDIRQDAARDADEEVPENISQDIVSESSQDTCQTSINTENNGIHEEMTLFLADTSTEVSINT